MAKQGRRRQWIVSGLQYRLLAGNFLYLLSVIMVFFAALFIPLIITLNSEHLPGQLRDDAAFQLLALHGRIWMILPFIVAFCIVHAVLVSHRIAGPLYRFKQIFRTLAQGDFSIRVVIRKADYLDDEAEVFNEMIRNVAARLRDVHQGYEEASRTLPELMQAVGQGSKEDAAVLAGRLGTQLDRLGRHVRAFKLPEPEKLDEALPAAIVEHAREPGVARPAG